MKRKCPYFISMIVINIILAHNIFAWDDKITHKDISEYAAEYSVLNSSTGNYMKSLGYGGELTEKFIWNNKTQSVLLWLREGAELEDSGNLLSAVVATARWKNHFHNPLKPWAEAGLTDIQTGESSLLWAQDSSNQQGFLEGDWSWQKVRSFYYFALTSTDRTDREAYFAQTFRGLGQQIHLLQDMAVPAHTRNDAHPLDAIIGTNGHGYYFETWAAKHIRNVSELRAFVPNPVIPNIAFNTPTDSGLTYGTLAPITQLYDTNQYDGTNPSTGNNIGLAEYTNANYFSDDTINMPGIWTSGDHTFPYPNAANTSLQDLIDSNMTPTTRIAEDGVTDLGIWVSKTGSEPIASFVKPGYLTTPVYTTIGGGHVYERTFFLDDQCHHDYAEKLLPRAVGYSAALLDYFFRGTLDVSWPDTGVYSISDGSQTPYPDANDHQHQQFTMLKAMVTNTTPNESIGAGTLTAVARYKIIPNYAPDLSNYPPDSTVMRAVQYSYSVSLPETVNVGDFTPGYYTEFTFDFTEHPIPAGITDLTLQVVFKGTLGNEVNNAVAVGMKDLMEPTHLTVWNLSDMFSLQYPGTEYQLYAFEQLQSMAQPGTSLLNWLDITPTPDGNNSLNDEKYLQPHDSTYTLSFWNGTGMIPALTVTIPAGRHIRPIVLVRTSPSG